MRYPLILAAAMLLAGCDRSAGTPAAGSASAAPTLAALGSADARSLALAPPGGNRPVDGEIMALQAKVQKAPERIDDWILLGRAWVSKAREMNDHNLYHNAQGCAEVVFEMDETNLMARNLVGQVELEEHRFEDARVTAEKILVEYPDDLPALGTLSDALLELGRYDESIKVTEQMADLKPNLPSYGRSAYLQWLKGDVEVSLKTWKAAAEAGRDPRLPEPRCWALVQAAHVFWHRGDYEGAKAGYRMALKELPGYAAGLLGDGKVALALGEPKHAAELLEQSFAKNPLLETAWRLGDARAAAGDAAGAEEAYAKVILGGEHDKRTAAQFLGVKNRDIEKAIGWAKEELGVRPGIYTWDAYAWALYRAARYPEAKEASDKANALGTKDATLIYHAGAIRIALGDKEEGRKLVKNALEMNPKFDPTGAPEAEKLLGETE